MEYPFNKLKYVEQRLLKLTEHFTMEQWNAVRSGNYWEVRDAMKSKDDRDAFLLSKIEQYLTEENY
jgi:hypothetical protein